jgi:hypothetical protein
MRVVFIHSSLRLVRPPQDGSDHRSRRRVARSFLKVLECVEGDEFVDDLAAFHDRSQHTKAYRYVCDRSADDPARS